MAYRQKIDKSDRQGSFSDFESIAERFRCVGGRYAATMTGFLGIGFGVLFLAVAAAFGYWSFTAFESRLFVVAVVAAALALLLGAWTSKFIVRLPHIVRRVSDGR